MKGAVSQVLDTCTSAEGNDGVVVPVEQVTASINTQYNDLSKEGFRTLGVAYKKCGELTAISKSDEHDMVFAGFITLFGILSSVFDYITFGVLLLFLHAKESEFQTGWFIESVVSATLIVLIVRTQHSFFKSKPGKYLALASVAVASVVLLLPLLPFASLFGFTTVPFIFYPAMLSITVLYIISAELLKKWFYKHSRN